MSSRSLSNHCYLELRKKLGAENIELGPGVKELLLRPKSMVFTASPVQATPSTTTASSPPSKPVLRREHSASSVKDAVTPLKIGGATLAARDSPATKSASTLDLSHLAPRWQSSQSVPRKRAPFMYKIRGIDWKATTVSRVPTASLSMNSADCFVLDCTSVVYACKQLEFLGICMMRMQGLVRYRLKQRAFEQSTLVGDWRISRAARWRRATRRRRHDCFGTLWAVRISFVHLMTTDCLRTMK
jgi:hypothetical protein